MVVLQGIIHVYNFLFNDNVYKMILHAFSSWVCNLLDIIKIKLSKLVIWPGLNIGISQNDKAVQYDNKTTANEQNKTFLY